MTIRRKIIRIVRIDSRHYYKIFGVTIKELFNFSKLLKLKDNEYKLKTENKKLKNKSNIIQTNYSYLQSDHSLLEKNYQKLNEEFKEELAMGNVYKSKSISFENELEIDQIRKFENNGKQFMELFLSEEFEDKFKKMTQNLTFEDKKKFKYIFSRMLSVYFMNNGFLFNEEEKLMQQNQEVFKKNNVDGDSVREFKIEGHYAFHAFFKEMGLTKKDKEFLKNKNIFDIGAYTGDTALILSKYTNQKVYAFEPFSNNFVTMENNIKINNVKNIIPIKKGISNNEETVNLFMHMNGDSVMSINPENATYSKNEYNFIDKIETTTIDNFIKKFNVKDLGLIKIDIEGSEQEAIEGSLETIKKFRPILLISIYHNASDFFEIKPIIEDLNLNYEFEIDKERPESFLGETMLYCRPID